MNATLDMNNQLGALQKTADPYFYILECGPKCECECDPDGKLLETFENLSRTEGPPLLQAYRSWFQANFNPVDKALSETVCRMVEAAEDMFARGLKKEGLKLLERIWPMMVTTHSLGQPLAASHVVKVINAIGFLSTLWAVLRYAVTARAFTNIETPREMAAGGEVSDRVFVQLAVSFLETHERLTLPTLQDVNERVFNIDWRIEPDVPGLLSLLYATSAGLLEPHVIAIEAHLKAFAAWPVPRTLNLASPYDNYKSRPRFVAP